MQENIEQDVPQESKLVIRVRTGTTLNWPSWPYTRFGQLFRVLSSPFELLYRIIVPHTIILGKEHLHSLPRVVIFAGTHHGVADFPLFHYALRKTPARKMRQRLLVPINAIMLRAAKIFGWYGVLAYGLYPLEQQRRPADSLQSLARQAATARLPIIIFPQGIPARPALEIANDRSVRFRSGVGYLATILQAPVVPFGLAGTEKAMPPALEEYNGLVIAGVPVSVKRVPLSIAFGEPINMKQGEKPKAFAERIEKICYELTRQAESALQEYEATSRKQKK